MSLFFSEVSIIIINDCCSTRKWECKSLIGCRCWNRVGDHSYCRLKAIVLALQLKFLRLIPLFSGSSGTSNYAEQWILFINFLCNDFQHFFAWLGWFEMNLSCLIQSPKIFGTWKSQKPSTQLWIVVIGFHSFTLMRALADCFPVTNEMRTVYCMLHNLVAVRKPTCYSLRLVFRRIRFFFRGMPYYSGYWL